MRFLAFAFCLLVSAISSIASAQAPHKDDVYWDASLERETGPNGTLIDVVASVKHNGTLYFAYNWTNWAKPPGIRSWDGSEWREILTPFNTRNTIYDMVVKGDSLIVVGNLARSDTEMRTIVIHNLVTKEWTDVPGPEGAYTIQAMATATNDLSYAVRWISAASSPMLWKHDSLGWTPVAIAVNTGDPNRHLDMSTVVISGNELFISGLFESLILPQAVVRE
jgi:hypothetical protein